MAELILQIIPADEHWWAVNENGEGTKIAVWALVASDEQVINDQKRRRVVALDWTLDLAHAPETCGQEPVYYMTRPTLADFLQAGARIASERAEAYR